MKEPLQTITSKNTCIKTFPRLFKAVTTFPELFEAGNVNLDYGGGKYDDVTDHLRDTFEVTNLVYDPFNRDATHNMDISYKLTSQTGADTCTMSNVLIVIQGETFRHRALVNAKHMMKHGAKIYITVYDGDRSGSGCETAKGWQENRSTKSYLELVKQVFPTAAIIKNVIVGVKA